jgi:hypothetical protein
MIHPKIIRKGTILITVANDVINNVGFPENMRNRAFKVRETIDTSKTNRIDAKIIPTTSLQGPTEKIKTEGRSGSNWTLEVSMIDWEFSALHNSTVIERIKNITL